MRESENGICGVEDRMASQIARVALAYLSLVKARPLWSTMTLGGTRPGQNLRS